MEAACVDLAVNLPVLTNPAQFDSVNRFARELNDRFAKEERRILSFAGIHPLCDGIEEKMTWIREQGFLGVKIHPDYQETYINDERYVRILRAARDLLRTALPEEVYTQTSARYAACRKGEALPCRGQRICLF